MVDIIKLIIQDFNNDYNLKATFDLEEDAKVGLIYIMGKIYTLVWLSQPRTEDLERLIRRYGKLNVILLCKVIYAPGRELLEQEGVSYLEWKGRTFFADAPAAANELNKNKENYFDQQVNESRINGRNGSAILLALAKHPELLKYPMKELAKCFRIKEATMYYYLSQFRKAGYLVKDKNGNFVINMKMINRDKLMGNIEAKGWHQLKANYNTLCVFPRLKKCKFWLEKDFRCVFVDELDYCENMCARIEHEIAKGVYVFISPYNKKYLPDFDETFRGDFKAWYAKRQFERWAEGM